MLYRRLFEKRGFGRDTLLEHKAHEASIDSSMVEEVEEPIEEYIVLE